MVDPFGQRRDDLRIALLAKTIVQALGGRRADGTPYDESDFLRLLDLEPRDRDAPLAPVAPAQSLAELEARIGIWCSGANVIAKEKGVR